MSVMGELIMPARGARSKLRADALLPPSLPRLRTRRSDGAQSSQGEQHPAV